MDNMHTVKNFRRVVRKDCAQAESQKDFNGHGDSAVKFQSELKKRRRCDPWQISASPKTWNSERPCMMPLIHVPSAEDCNSNTSSLFTGTATRGQSGPCIGAMDIGVSKSAYFFRVALPGVKKDPGEFSCEIECDGKVHVRGSTSTGGQTVSRHSRVFEMKIQQQCPPGPFTLSFSLPGPVDPRLFVPNFRSDGIFEAVVAKNE